MADKTIRLGSDLRLLRNLDIRKSSRDPGHDLATTHRQGITDVDLETLSYAENMIQALFLRFLTPAGELAVLGHPEYGSRLSDLIGELNNETTRNRAKLFVLEALAAEPRVQDDFVSGFQVGNLRLQLPLLLLLWPDQEQIKYAKDQQHRQQKAKTAGALKQD